MARLTGPLDVPYANVRNTRRVIEPALDQTGAQLTALGNATQEILGRVRDQQIENQVVDAELKTRRDLDQLRIEIENAPASDGEDYGERWQQRADEIVERNAANLQAPRAARLWRQRTGEMLVRERAGIDQFAQRRLAESARAGLLATIGTAQTTLIDENATPEARAQAMTAIETTVRRAVERRTIAADDGERMIQAARANQAAFEQEQGMTAQAQSEEDRIYAESNMDMATAMEMARDIDNPSLRDRVEDRLAVRFNREETARRDALDGAMGRAYARIEQNGSLDGLAPADRQLIIERGQMDTLRNYQRNRAGGGAGTEASNRMSEDRRNAFIALSQEDELATSLADLDLYEPLSESAAEMLGMEAGQSVAAQVRPGDLRMMRERQRQMRGEIPLSESANIGQRAYQMLWSFASTQAQAAGIGLSGRQEDADNVRRLRGFLQREATAFVENERRLPNQREIQEITALALTQSRRGGVLGIGGASRRVFEAQPNERYGSNVRVNFARILAYQRKRLARAYIQSGRELPADDAAARRIIEDMYQRELAGGVE